MSSDLPERLRRIASDLAVSAGSLTFSPPVAAVYNPLVYAATVHERYLELYAVSTGIVFFLGMNPGPFGMAQTGIPFGAIPPVRDWMGIQTQISHPPKEHPKRPVTGFDCTRVEASGKRLWGFFSGLYPQAKDFFARAFVANYCPLVFMNEAGANITPDKLPPRERDPLFSACDTALSRTIDALQPIALVGVGGFAEQRLRLLPAEMTQNRPILRITHPSPANPAANRDWPGSVTAALSEAGLWPLPLPGRRDRS